MIQYRNFSEKTPPVVVKAKMQKIRWGFRLPHVSMCRRLPKPLKTVSSPEEILLYPYGCAKLRMTEMPLLIKNN